MDALAARASALVAPPRGILATGPGGAAMSGRLTAAGVPPTAENRRAFRELLITAPGLRAGLSGVILDAEGMDQLSSDGLALPEAIGAAGLMTGVRANADRHPLPGTRGETITEGPDGLPARLEGWARRGVRDLAGRAADRAGDPAAGGGPGQRAGPGAVRGRLPGGRARPGGGTAPGRGRPAPRRRGIHQSTARP